MDVNFGNIGKLGGGGGYLAALLENRCTQWFFVLSCVATVAGTNSPNTITLIGALLSLIVAYYLTFRRNILVHLFNPFSPKIFYLASAAALIAIGFNVPFCLSYLLVKFSDLPYRVLTIAGIPQTYQTSFIHIFGFAGCYCLYLTTAPVFCAFFYAFIIHFGRFIKELYLTSDKIERVFFVTVVSIALIAVAIIYNQTNCFYAPIGQDGKIIEFDVVFTSDSGNYHKTNVFGYINARENDLRQPLFGLFAMPFAVIATVCSWGFFFIPNSYAVFIQAIQIELLSIAYILASRLLRLNGVNKTCFLMAMILTYPVLLFSLTWEQYIFATFWLFVYIYVTCGSKQNLPLLFITASGSLMVSSAVWFFTMTKNWQQLLRNYINNVGCFFIFFVLAGRLETLKCIEHVSTFSNINQSFSGKLLQFVNYVYACWFKPHTIVLSSFEHPVLGICNHYSYQLAPVESLNLFGLIFLAIAFLGFVLNYKDKFAQICAFWIAFSFSILCIFGWGTSENGLILYSLYFGWAYFCLVFLALEKLLQKLPIVKYSVYAACIAALAYINIPAMYDLVQFGIKYYPCP